MATVCNSVHPARQRNGRARGAWQQYHVSWRTYLSALAAWRLPNPSPKTLQTRLVMTSVNALSLRDLRQDASRAIFDSPPVMRRFDVANVFAACPTVAFGTTCPASGPAAGQIFLPC